MSEKTDVRFIIGATRQSQVEGNQPAVPEFVGRISIEVPIISKDTQESVVFQFENGVLPTIDEVQIMIAALHDKLVNNEFSGLEWKGFGVAPLKVFREATARTHELNKELEGKQIFSVSGESQ